MELECDGNIEYYFLLPCGGGITLEHEYGDIVTLTPDAPLYQSILGQSPGSLVGEQNSLILEII